MVRHYQISKCAFRRNFTSDEQLVKWKFAYISFSRLTCKYFQDSDIVLSRFQKNVYGPWEQCLGLEHSGVTKKRLCLSNQSRKSFEKAVKSFQLEVVIISSL